ncbi:hypothetical protein EmuJ_000066100 [Echinococcus multilocularis]|uniref:Uncharacterized protein n=1 Tax=Echinococcus multilocularis TaxID=6211 RepID=A0A087VXC0_ECHMU|nr:hypothetical protein EmuJ_000066100 [Echinococcus multilocularis]
MLTTPPPTPSLLSANGGIPSHTKPSQTMERCAVCDGEITEDGRQFGTSILTASEWRDLLPYASPSQRLDLGFKIKFDLIWNPIRFCFASTFRCCPFCRTWYGGITTTIMRMAECIFKTGKDEKPAE